MKRYLCLLGLAFGICCGAAVAQKPEGIKFEVPVLPDAARHLDLLAVPAYLALALENNGLSPSLSSRLEIRSRESFQIKAGVVRFTGRKGPVFNYEAGVNLSFGVGESSFTVRVEVDTSTLEQGTITVRVFPPLAKLVPRPFIERVEFKIRALANLQAQQKVLAYLDRVSKEQQGNKRGFDGMLEAIVFDAYNRSGGTAATTPVRNRGEAEPLSDQLMLLATLAIWLVGFPLFLFFIRMRRNGRRPE